MQPPYPSGEALLRGYLGLVAVNNPLSLNKALFLGGGIEYPKILMN